MAIQVEPGEVWDRAGAIRAIRRRFEWSQRDLAAVAGIGGSTVNDAENARSSVSLTVVEAILAAAGMRFAVIDVSTGEELETEPVDVVKDRAGRRLPAHLNARPVEVPWWPRRRDREAVDVSYSQRFPQEAPPVNAAVMAGADADARGKGWRRRGHPTEWHPTCEEANRAKTLRNFSWPFDAAVTPAPKVRKPARSLTEHLRQPVDWSDPASIARFAERYEDFIPAPRETRRADTESWAGAGPVESRAGSLESTAGPGESSAGSGDANPGSCDANPGSGDANRGSFEVSTGPNPELGEAGPGLGEAGPSEGWDPAFQEAEELPDWAFDLPRLLSSDDSADADWREQHDWVLDPVVFPTLKRDLCARYGPENLPAWFSQDLSDHVCSEHAER